MHLRYRLCSPGLVAVDALMRGVVVVSHLRLPAAFGVRTRRTRRKRRLTSLGERAMIGKSGIERMPMKRHDDTQRSGRLTVTQPVHHPVPPYPRTPVPPYPRDFFRSCRSLTTRADRHACTQVPLRIAIAVQRCGASRRPSPSGAPIARAFPGRPQPSALPESGIRSQNPARAFVQRPTASAAFSTSPLSPALLAFPENGAHTVPDT